MKNMIHDGTKLEWIAPAGGVVSGQGYIVGDMFAIASYSASEGEKVSGDIVGTFTMDMVLADVASSGDLGYWDDTAKKVTLAAAAGANEMIGCYAEDKANNKTNLEFRLNGIVLV